MQKHKNDVYDFKTKIAKHAYSYVKIYAYK